MIYYNIREKRMITGKTKLLGFFGDPAEHSKSPLMHNEAFGRLGLDYAYLSFRIKKGEIGPALDAMKALDMRGVNISMPHKEDVLNYLDEVDDLAGLCGAVNTVINNDGLLTGYNTDVKGFLMALEDMTPIGGKKVTVLGMGGAAKAVLIGLALEKAEHINVFLRSERDEGFIQKLREQHGTDILVFNLNDEESLRSAIAHSEILINATPVGMGVLQGESLISDGDFFHQDLYVMDLIYDPEETKLLSQAKEAGCRGYKNGLDMLLYQGGEAFRLFTGEEAPIDVMRDALIKKA